MGRALLGGLLALVVAPQTGRGGAATFDVVVRHGTVVDGSGRARYDADVGVRLGRVVAVGDLSAANATNCCSGVTPCECVACSLKRRNRRSS